MDTEKALLILEGKLALRNLFSVGPGKGTLNVYRYHLDEYPIKGLDLFAFLHHQLSNDVQMRMGAEFFVCLSRRTSSPKKKYPNKALKEVRFLGIEVPEDAVYRCESPEEEGDSMNLLFYPGNPQDISKYVWGVLAHNFPKVEPALNSDVFFVSADLKRMVNIYDDRGMDVVEL